MMPQEDAIRWNQRYTSQKYERFNVPTTFLVDHHELIPEKSFVLDVATGMGRNAGYLIEHGHQVVGVDISYAGLSIAKHKLPALNAILADLVTYQFPSQCFDAILNFYYFQKNLWLDFRRMLKPGGVIFVETLTIEMKEINPAYPDEFLLQNGELLDIFKDWEILVYQEGWKKSDNGHLKSVASLIAKVKTNEGEDGV